VDQLSGEPLPPAVSVFVGSGGPAVNGPVAYYEQNHETTLAPVHYGSPQPGWGAFYDSSTDNQIPGTLVELATLPGPPKTDYFLIECFVDNNGNTVLIIYGYGGLGTFAGALYFKEVLHPTSEDVFTPGWWIYRWRDLNGNGLPDMPAVDSIDLVASSP